MLRGSSISWVKVVRSEKCKISLKLKDFPLKKKIERKKKRVRVRKMNLLDVALRKIESVQSPKINLKLKDFPPKKEIERQKKKKSKLELRKRTWWIGK